MRLQHLMVTARRFTVIVEEKLLLKLLSFFGYGQTEAGGSLLLLAVTVGVAGRAAVKMRRFIKAELEKVGENLHERSTEDAGPPKRYYFENLKISLPQVKLSVFTSHKLPPDLKVNKQDFTCYK